MAAVLLSLCAAQGQKPTAVQAQASANESRPAVVPSLSPAQQTELTRAKAAAAEILARPEFQPPQQTWWDRLKSKLLDLIARFFMGVDRVTTSQPWVGRLLVWTLFLGAAVGVLVWLLRTVRRQHLRVATGDAAQAKSELSHATEEWQRLADRHASDRAWREAIHALYWAAIVHLEQRRAWRHNPSRTPREYVRLLKAGSEEQTELRGLTRMLEKTWYGQREAQAEEFHEARQSFERIAHVEKLAGDRA